jgi:hypothetical protein
VSKELIERTRDELIAGINAEFDILLARISGNATADVPTEYMLRLDGDTNRFIGAKITAVLFGDERVEVKNWRKAFELILNRCNRERHEELMALRNRTAGKTRIFLSDKPDGMSYPHRIDDELWVEEHYGNGTLFHILCHRILSQPSFSDSRRRASSPARYMMFR